jgi:hypothetical protein
MRQPPEYTYNGETYTAILSPKAVRAMERECGYGYATIISNAVSKVFLGDMLALCAACLQWCRGPEFDSDALAEEMDVFNTENYAKSMEKLRILSVAIAMRDSPDPPEPGDEVAGDPGNAELPPTDGGPGSATIVTATSKPATRKK